jgi:hypothetical protein
MLILSPARVIACRAISLESGYYYSPIFDYTQFEKRYRMSGNLTDDWNKQLIDLKEHIAEKIAPEVNKLFKESVSYSLVDYYNDYNPQAYQRTNNFMNVLKSARTSGKGNVITMSVDSGYMNSYPSWIGGNKLQPSTAFDFFFMGGEHGHGRWMMKQSLPPYMYVDADIESGFGGRIDKIIDKEVDKILK